MLNKIKVLNLISERSKLGPNDPQVETYWAELANLLGENEEQTIEFLMNCNKADIRWISEVFEDISYKLQSTKLIDCLKMLDKKFPELKLAWFVKGAEEVLL
ncbi:MAG TPA: hypothetical protein VF941_16935 [Clostridia bacterium]